MHTSCAFARAQSACGDPISSACAPHRSYSSAGDEEKAQRRWRPTGRGNVALRRPSAAAQPQPNAQIAHAPLDCLRANGPLQQRCIRRKTRGAVVHINRNAPRLSSVYTSACKHARLGNTSNDGLMREERRAYLEALEAETFTPRATRSGLAALATPDPPSDLDALTHASDGRVCLGGEALRARLREGRAASGCLPEVAGCESCEAPGMVKPQPLVTCPYHNP